MPLKCLESEREVYAFDMETDEAWESLRKANAEGNSLRMPCCGAGVVLRKSKLGTKHFAHARRGPCDTAPETVEHLLAKMAVVQGIKATTWQALPEQAGQNLSGESWRADVLAVKNAAKVAFEIQWSRQDDDETMRRQKRYADAGVRGLWLFRQRDFPTSNETPCFRLVFDETAKTFDVLLPSSNYDKRWVKHDKDDTRSWGQRIPLREFVMGALGGQLRFAPILGRTLPVVVEAARIKCWRCKKDTRAVIGLIFSASRILPGCSDIHTSIYDLAEHLPDGATEVMSILKPDLLKKHGIGAVKLRWSKTVGKEYLSNGCTHCDALQGKFFDHEYFFETYDALETQAVFKTEWGQSLHSAKSGIYHWWFEQSFK